MTLVIAAASAGVSFIAAWFLFAPREIEEDAELIDHDDIMEVRFTHNRNPD